MSVLSKERLTETFDKYNQCNDKNCKLSYCDRNCEHYQRMVDKLAEYEDLEEQGLILRLPCKVGDTVYSIDKEARNPIVTMIVTEIRFKALRSGKVITKILCSDDVMTKTNGCLVYYEEEIGKKLFFTQSEAEEKLRELEGK